MAILWKRPLSPDLPFSLSLWGWGMPWKPTFRICTSTNSGDWSTPQQLPALCSKWTRSVIGPPLFGQVWILCITFYCQSWEAAHCMLMSLDLQKLYSTCIYWNKELYHLYYYIKVVEVDTSYEHFTWVKFNKQLEYLVQKGSKGFQLPKISMVLNLEKWNCDDHAVLLYHHRFIMC